MVYENNCGGIDNILEGDVENMPPIDLDTVDVILDQHGKQLDKFDTRITDLEKVTTKILISQGEMNIKLSNIENGQLKIEKHLLESNNNQQNFQKELIEKIIDNDAKIIVSKTEGKSKIYVQLIILLGGIITGSIAIYTTMVN